MGRFKITLGEILDKTSFESSIVMANVVNVLLQKNRFFIAQDNELPSLNEILNYPNTEDSKRIAAFLRSLISMCFNENGYKRGNTWVKYFWNQSYKIEPYKL